MDLNDSLVLAPKPSPPRPDLRPPPTGNPGYGRLRKLCRSDESIAAPLAVSHLILEGTAMPTSTATRTPTRPQGKPQPSEDEREQARRALQTSLDTRQ